MFTYAKRGTQGWSDVMVRMEGASPARPSRNTSPGRRHWMPTSRTEPIRGNRFAPQAYVQSRATQSEPALSLSRPSDASEREADALAERVLSSPSAPGWAAPVSSANHAPVQRRCGDMGGEEARGGEGESPEAEMPGRGEAPPESSRGIAAAVEGLGVGEPLAPGPRQFFERRFGYEFSGVRVHADGKAAQAARALSAKAFTLKNQIAFAEGCYRTESESGRQLLAHELAHVIQQGQATPRAGASATPVQRSSPSRTVVQRAIELRPPGRGEASAFQRRQELVDRLNAQSAAIRYSLAADGRTLRYLIVAAANLTTFDRQMRGFIDNSAVIPLRLITGAGLVAGTPGAYEPLIHDSWVSAYLDVDDLLASDDAGFQTQMVHILAERAATRNYEQRIGSFPDTQATLAEFDRVHNTAHDAEAQTLQGLVGDPSIRFLYTELKPNQTFVVAFRSNEGYRIYKVFRGIQRTVVGAEVFVQMPNGTRLTIEQLRARRAAAGAASAPAPGAP